MTTCALLPSALARDIGSQIVARDWQLVLYVCMYVFPSRFWNAIKPRHMREGLQCFCVSVHTAPHVLAATYLVYVSKVRRYTVSCRFFKICICTENFSFVKYGVICLPR